MSEESNREDIDKLVHDGKSCLNSISINAELAKMVASRGHDPKKICELMEIVLKQCQKCSETLEDYRTSRS